MGSRASRIDCSLIKMRSRASRIDCSLIKIGCKTIRINWTGKSGEAVG
jgi:hypothetical protein